MENVLPDWQWWSNWGVLGVIVLFVLMGIVEWWRTKKPHYVAELEAKTNKERLQGEYIQQMKETEKERLLISSSLASSLETLTTVHAQKHDKTHRALGNIARAGRAATDNPEVRVHLDRAEMEVEEP